MEKYNGSSMPLPINDPMTKICEQEFWSK